MGSYINKKLKIDADTGEIFDEKLWLGYDGFNENGYRYRSKACHIRYFYDSLPDNYDADTLMLLFMIAEIMNNENVLVTRVKRKSKFSNILYLPMDKDDIRSTVRYTYGINKFDRCWRKLIKYALKKIQYNGKWCWAVNPSIVSKCNYVPFWLYEEFQESMNPHLSANTINKLQRKLRELYYDEDIPK